MSEEQSAFKVTDRRLFNTDGSPRDIEREEAPALPTATPTSGISESTSSTAQSNNTATATAPVEEPRASATANPVITGTDTQIPVANAPEELPEEAYAEGDIPGADDPTSFVNFLMSIASNAAASLGMMEHPVTGQRGVDLPLGKHWIDVLGMLQDKTRGNLSPQEQQIFLGLLSDLRMQYVSLTGATAPKRPGGFTGSDILGGK